MEADVDLAATAALIGERTRAQMLLSLLDGRPRSAGDLARHAGVSPATASQHLARLLDGGVLTVSTDGRHRFYAVANAHVGAALEALATISPRRPVRSLRQANAAERLHRARSCYDHLAGRVGVVLSAALVERGAIAALAPGEIGVLRDPEHPLLRALGVPLPLEAASTRRPLVRGCLDWTERRPHLAGHLGALLLSALLGQGWLDRRTADRSLSLTPAGIGHLSDALELPRDELLDVRREGP